MYKIILLFFTAAISRNSSSSLKIDVEIYSFQVTCWIDSKNCLISIIQQNFVNSYKIIPMI